MATPAKPTNRDATSNNPPMHGSATPLDDAAIIDLAHTAYVHAGAMNIDALVAMFADDIVMELPFAPPPWPKLHVGKSAVVAFQRRAARSFDTFSLTVDRALATTERIAVVEANSVGTTTDGRSYTNRYCTVLEFDEAGMITRWTEYYDPIAVLSAFAPLGAS